MQQTTGLIFDLRRFSVHDGPGIRTTVFLQGCPLTCWWCHNPESQPRRPHIMLWPSRCIGCMACIEACPQQAIYAVDNAVSTDLQRCTGCGTCIPSCPSDARQWVGREVSTAQVMAEIERDITFYDESGGGVTFSGGEPLMQPHFLLALLQACRAQEIHTTLDTSGYASWDVLDQIRPYVDLFLYDVKSLDDAVHRQATGVSNARILSNLRALAERLHKIILRVPLIPGINMSDADTTALIDLAASLPTVTRVDLLPYHYAAAGKYERLQLSYNLSTTQPPSDESVNALADVLKEAGLSVKIGG